MDSEKCVFVTLKYFTWLFGINDSTSQLSAVASITTIFQRRSEIEKRFQKFKMKN
jgi:hypothetical protein